MSFETVSCGFQRKMRFKRRHFFLVASSSGGGNKWLEVGRDLGRRKLIEPGLVTGSFELTLLNGHIEEKPAYAIQQGCYYAHQRFHRCSAKRTDGGVAQDGIVLLEGAVGSFGCGSQAMQLAVTFRASGDFQKQARVLGNGNVSGKTKLFGSMGTIPEKFDNGRVFGLHALLEAGKGKPLRGGIPSIAAISAARATVPKGSGDNGRSQVNSIF